MESKKQIPNIIGFKEMKATLLLQTTDNYILLLERPSHLTAAFFEQAVFLKKNATTRTGKVAILFAKSATAAAVSKLGSFDLKIVVDTFGLF